MNVVYQFTSQLSGRGHGGNNLFMLRSMSLTNDMHAQVTINMYDIKMNSLHIA